MFGYIQPHKDELKVREYKIFRGYYCGLCKVLGREFNQFVRLGLNYDITFLAILLSSLDDKRDIVRAETCIAGPFKKKPIIQPNKYILYSAYISVILIYFKLLDDWKDEKRILSRLGTIPYIFAVKKAEKIYSNKYEKIKYYLDKLSYLEKTKCPIIDESADQFAKLMEELAIPPFEYDEKTTRVLKWLGYNVGRWIYILDAFNDIEKDINTGNYNPILVQYKYDNNEEIGEFVDRVRETIQFTLTFTLDNIAKSYELLNIKYNKNIIDNIIYLGTRRKMELIMNKGVVKSEKSV